MTHGTPLTQAVQATAASGERLELHLVLKAAASDEPEGSGGGGGGGGEGGGGDGSAGGAKGGGHGGGSRGGSSLVLTLLAPFEVRNETESTLALCASLDRKLTLLLPPLSAGARRGASAARTLLGSWGAREAIEPDRKYLVKLAAAAPEMGAAAGAAEGDDDPHAEGVAPPLLTSPEGGPLEWSAFLSVSRPACVTLAAETGEAIQVVDLSPDLR